MLSCHRTNLLCGLGEVTSALGASVYLCKNTSRWHFSVCVLVFSTERLLERKKEDKLNYVASEGMRVGEPCADTMVRSEACGLWLGHRFSTELAPSPSPSGIPVALTADCSFVQSTLLFPVLPGFRLSRVPVTSSIGLLTVCSANCLHLPLLCQGIRQKERWVNVGGPSGRETPEPYSIVQESQGGRRGSQSVPSEEGPQLMPVDFFALALCTSRNGACHPAISSTFCPDSELCSPVPSC